MPPLAVSSQCHQECTAGRAELWVGEDKGVPEGGPFQLWPSPDAGQGGCLSQHSCFRPQLGPSPLQGALRMPCLPRYRISSFFRPEQMPSSPPNLHPPVGSSTFFLSSTQSICFMPLS